MDLKIIRICLIYSSFFILTRGSHRQKTVVLKAQCQSFCLGQYGSLIGEPLLLYNFYQPAVDCAKDDGSCLQCFSQCRNTDESLEQCQQVCASEACFACCDFIHEWQQINPLSPEPAQSAISTSFDNLAIHCQAVYVNYPDETRVYVRWQMASTSGGWQSQQMALVFLVDIRATNRQQQITQWSSFTSVHGLVPVVVNTSTLYQFRVTPILHDGIAGEPALSSWIQTIPSSYRPDAPASVLIEKQVIVDSRLYVVISWKPPPDRPVCHFKLVMLPDSNTLPAIEHSIDVLPEFLYEFGPLEFDTYYDVHLAACTAEYVCSKAVAKTNFQTMTCLEATSYDYNLCAPGILSNVEKVQLLEELNVNGTEPFCYVSYNLSWSQIPFLSDALYHISIEWHKEPKITSPLQVYITDITGSIRLSPNSTSFTLEKLHSGSTYRVRLTVSSVGGESSPTKLYIKVTAQSTSCKEAADEEATHLSDGEMLDISSFVVISISLILFCGGAVMILYAYKKRKLCFKTLLKLENSASRGNPLYHAVQMTFSDGSSAQDESTRHMDEFEVDLQALTFGKLLGQGAFGKVVKGELLCLPDWMSSQQVHLPMAVAIKMTKDFATEEDRHGLAEEIALMKTLGRHSNLVSIVACVTQHPNTLALVMDYCQHGDLKTHLRRIREQFYPMLNLVGPANTYGSSCTRSSEKESSNGYISEECGEINDQEGTVGESEERGCLITEDISEARLLSYARQIATGMEYLAQKKFVHRDLATRNILVCDDNVIKISDFGLTRDIYEDSLYKKVTTGKVPVKWMSIEAIFDQIYTTQSDVWSFGIVLWEIVTLGGTPYPGISNKELFTLLKSGYRMEKPENCSEKLYEVMLACWNSAPVSRPTFSGLRTTLDGMLEGCLDETDAYLSFNINSSSTCYADTPDNTLDDTPGCTRDDLHASLQKKLSNSTNNQDNLNSVNRDHFQKNSSQNLHTEAQIPPISQRVKVKPLLIQSHINVASLGPKSPFLTKKQRQYASSDEIRLTKVRQISELVSFGPEDYREQQERRKQRLNIASSDLRLKQQSTSMNLLPTNS